MITLDEAIAHAKEKAKEIRENIIDGNNLEPYESYCDAMTEQRAEEHEQLAEWLEELKILRLERMLPTTNEIIASKVGYDKGYNKAIDDFAEKLKEKYDYLPQILSQEAFDAYVDEYAEQLKVDEKS